MHVYIISALGVSSAGDSEAQITTLESVLDSQVVVICHSTSLNI